MNERKYAEVFKAFAEGKEIQYRMGYEWIDFSATQNFKNCEWRVKPEPVIKERFVELQDGALYINPDVNKNNVRFVFEDGNLINVEMLK